MAEPTPWIISTDHALLDLDTIHGFLSTCYWSPGLDRTRMERAMANSMCIGAYDPGVPRAARPALPAQAGFARVITDRASFAYLCDVFVLDAYRGRGLARLMVRTAIDHPDLRGIRRFCLLTRDAHGVYAPLGFGAMPDPSRYMERVDGQGYRHP